ncbi:hypothetical protein ACJX0J_024983 [Zea mays]
MLYRLHVHEIVHGQHTDEWFLMQEHTDEVVPNSRAEVTQGLIATTEDGSTISAGATCLSLESAKIPQQAQELHMYFHFITQQDVIQTFLTSKESIGGSLIGLLKYYDKQTLHHYLTP